MSELTLTASKRCIVCGEVKPHVEFNKRHDSRDGLRNDCRSCCRARQQEYWPAYYERTSTPPACTVCGSQFKGPGRRCPDCRVADRTCGQCGNTFRGSGTKCRPCSRKKRHCTYCGRLFRGSNARCITCYRAKRTCINCGRIFTGHARRCGACWSTERACTDCGKVFKGYTRRCGVCSSSERECLTCGKTFKGRKTRCSSCINTQRECVQCGCTFKGHQKRCFTCQSGEGECSDCGRTFKGTSLRCPSCMWLDLPLEERIAKAQQRHGRRRALKLAAEIDGPVPAAMYAAIMASGLCSYCGKPPRTVDHILPLARGGIEHESNLTPACKRCNSSKNAKLLTEWHPDRVAYGVATCSKVAAEYERQVAGAQMGVSA